MVGNTAVRVLEPYEELDVTRFFCVGLPQLESVAASEQGLSRVLTLLTPCKR